MTTLREAQKQMTRRLLLDTSLAMFEGKGYSATTIDDIAAGAGTTRTTFYMHFPSKAQMMRHLVTEANEIFVSADDPPLTEVVRSGDREVVRRYLETKATQWADVRAYIVAINQAAAVEPEIASDRDVWFEEAIASMHAGLDAAERFDPDSRRIRCVLAFGELEFLSLRWIRHGWLVPREVALAQLTDSWYHLLADG